MNFPGKMPRAACPGLHDLDFHALCAQSLPVQLLVVKADERTGHFRERSAHLNQYTQAGPGSCGNQAQTTLSGGQGWLKPLVG